MSSDLRISDSRFDLKSSWLAVRPQVEAVRLDINDASRREKELQVILKRAAQFERAADIVDFFWQACCNYFLGSFLNLILF
jgi:hypothetical protein